MNKRMGKSFEINFDHFQFLIGDRKRGPLVDTSSLWDKSQIIGIVVDVPEIVGISTVRYGGKLQVGIQVARNPEIDCNSWDRIGEFEINLPSGELIVWAPETEDIDQSPTVSVPSGRYLGVAYSRGTDDVTDEMETVGSDEYCVVISRLSDEVENRA